MDINISYINWKKIIDFAQSAYDEFKSEIGGMAIVYIEDDDYVIDEPVILKQEISASNTILDREALAEYYVKTAMKHKKKKGLQLLWWHSHHTMSAFWSSTDLAAIDEFSEGFMSMSLVVNLEEEYEFRVNYWKPYPMHEDVEINIIGRPDRKVPKKISQQVKSYCSPITLPARTYNGYGHYVRYKPGKNNQTTLFDVGNKVIELDKTKAIVAPGEFDEMHPILSDTYSYLHEEIQHVINGFCDGTQNYNQFKTRLCKLQDECIENGLDDISIAIPTSKECKDKLLMMNPTDLIIDSYDYGSDYSDSMDYH